MVSRSLFPIAALIGAALVISACGRTEPVASAATTTTSAPTVSVTAAPATTEPTAAPEQPSSYVVQPGDSVGGIATAFGLKADDLAAYNNLDNPDRIAAGQQILIPPGATSTSTTPTTAAAPPPEPTETTAAG